MEKVNSNFHLKDGSPCLCNSADSVEVNGMGYYFPIIDFEGNPEPNPSETSPDFGAFKSNLSKASNK